ISRHFIRVRYSSAITAVKLRCYVFLRGVHPVMAAIHRYTHCDDEFLAEKPRSDYIFRFHLLYNIMRKSVHIMMKFVFGLEIILDDPSNTCFWKVTDIFGFGRNAFFAEIWNEPCIVSNIGKLFEENVSDGTRDALKS
ncbi:hypothetical protein J437_LFUL017396, partial [Ladona fulva]